MTGEELAAYVAAENGGVCLLAFSRGKDSIGTWIQARRFFSRIVPFHCWLVPGMEFEERSLAYYRQAFGSEILSVPHPAVSRFLANQVFTDPRDCGQFDDLMPHTYQDVYAHVAKVAGVSPLTLCAVGVRSADSIHRRKAIMRTGGINESKGKGGGKGGGGRSSGT